MEIIISGLTGKNIYFLAQDTDDTEIPGGWKSAMGGVGSLLVCLLFINFFFPGNLQLAMLEMLDQSRMVITTCRKQYHSYSWDEDVLQRENKSVSSDVRSGWFPAIRDGKAGRD